MQTQIHKAEDIVTMKVVGDLTAEIVNIGQHPLYISSVSLAIEPEREQEPGDDPRYWEFAPIKSSNPLEPGAVAYFRIQKFDFEKHPLNANPNRNENYVVIVNSNKAVIFRSAAPFTGYSFAEK